MCVCALVSRLEMHFSNELLTHLLNGKQQKKYLCFPQADRPEKQTLKLKKRDDRSKGVMVDLPGKWSINIPIGQRKEDLRPQKEEGNGIKNVAIDFAKIAILCVHLCAQGIR